jgi:hypothetical protein
MTDISSKKDLTNTLERLEQGWQELSRLLQEQAEQENRTIVAEKFVLADAQGQTRGTLEARPDGSCGLILLDRAGRFRAWFGVKENGNAYLSLKDEMGRVVFEAQDFQSPGIPAAAPAFEAFPATPGEAAQSTAAGSQEETPDPAPAEQSPARGKSVPQGQAADGLMERLEHLEQQSRLMKWLGGMGLALLLAALGLASYATNRILVPKPKPVAVQHEVTAPALVITGETGAPVARLGSGQNGVRLEFLDHQGGVRASLGLQRDGSPHFGLYDEQQHLRAELALAGPEAEPGLGLVDRAGLLRVALGSIDPRFKVPEYLLERPVSSLVLINKDGDPIWHAPTKWRR